MCMDVGHALTDGLALRRRLLSSWRSNFSVDIKIIRIIVKLTPCRLFFFNYTLIETRRADSETTHLKTVLIASLISGKWSKYVVAYNRYVIYVDTISNGFFFFDVNIIYL